MYKICIIFFWAVTCGGSLLGQENAPYRNSLLSSEARTADLLARMTLAEKIGQLCCLPGWEMYERIDDAVIPSEKFKEEITRAHTGMLWATFRADPWTKKTLSNGLNPELAAKASNALQAYALKNTRLGIPLFFAEEAPHGHMAIGTTVFPSGIGQASTWNPDLLEQMGAVISKEIRLQGGHISYGPVIDISRDPRWSRVEESFGEDHVLTARLASAIAKGNGAGRLHGEHSTITTLKHFVAYGVPEGGHNGNSAVIGKRELYEVFLPPFKHAIEAGALSVMTAYNSIDGTPCTSNGELLTDVLRHKWGFQGAVISDLVSIDGLVDNHHVAADMEAAATLAIAAGVDVDLGGNAFAKLEDALKSGNINMAMIDTAVYRILKLKFDMGLFDHPYVDPGKTKVQVRAKEHIALARRIAQESIVLLKNKENILPLNNTMKIAVLGPNADNRYNMLGDYTAPQDEKNVKTVLDGIQARLPRAQVRYVKGCSIRDTSHVEIDAAVAAVRESDVAIVVVGGSSARDFRTDYLQTGAAVASSPTLGDMEGGEGFDRATLALLGKQLDLLQAVRATGKPLVVVYIQGRPLQMGWAKENADALLTAWYPGQEGGQAIADVLFGDYNPAGRLPISVPRHEGQLPVHYNKKNPRGHDYVEMTADPLYPFGYGLSYTTFEYADVRVEQKGANSFEVSFSLKNTGTRSGDEVAQLYIRDEVASVVQPIKQLRHFARIHLSPGQEQRLAFMLTAEDLSVVNAKLENVVEPGQFTLMVGSASNDIRLVTQIEVK